MSTRESRDAQQDRALIALLRALPEDRLERVLAGAGVEPEKLPGRAGDNRRCSECGYGYLQCRARDGKVLDLAERHEWSPR